MSVVIIGVDRKIFVPNFLVPSFVFGPNPRVIAVSLIVIRRIEAKELWLLRMCLLILLHLLLEHPQGAELALQLWFTFSAVIAIKSDCKHVLQN